MGKGARWPRLRGAHVQQSSWGLPETTGARITIRGRVFAINSGLETEALILQVVGVGSLNEMGKMRPHSAWGLTQKLGLEEAPVAALGV